MAVISQQRSKLWFAAAVVWLAWLASVLVMWVYYPGRALPLHFLPLMSLLFLQFGGGLVLVVAALWRAIRGPRRVTATGWLLVGITPLWLSTAHLSYGAWSLYVEHAALTVPVKMASVTVSSLADMVARYRHRQRSEGKHVILFHDSADPQDEQLAEIDRHVEEMEALLGQSLQSKIHWIRGPLFDRQLGGWSLNGLAVVISPPARVANIDRHEVAHAVIDRHSDAQPPTLLAEGWAESQSGYEPGFLALRAWEHRQWGEWLNLRTLTGEVWSRSGDHLIYTFGGPLVEYLLDKYGGAKFLELYTTCRRETFADDCRRVLGVDLDTLDAHYWAFIEKRVSDLPPERTNPLWGARLGDGVDREAWNDFARQYPGAREALAKSLEQVTLDFHGTFQPQDAQPKPIRVSIVHDGPNRRLSVEGTDEHYARVATPSRSFFVRRRDGGEPWRLDLDQYRGGYWALRTSLEVEEGDFIVGGPEDIFKWRFVDALDRDDFRVTRFERSGDDGEPSVRLEFEYVAGLAPEDWRHEESFVLLPERHWAMRESEARLTGKDFSGTSRTRFEYGDERLPAGVPSAAHWSYESTKGRFRRDLTLTEWNRQPPAEAFALETFGLSASELPDPLRVPWYVKLSAIAAPVSLVVGLVLLAAARRANLSGKFRGRSPLPVPRPDA